MVLNLQPHAFYYCAHEGESFSTPTLEYLGVKIIGPQQYYLVTIRPPWMERPNSVQDYINATPNSGPAITYNIVLASR